MEEQRASQQEIVNGFKILLGSIASTETMFFSCWTVSYSIAWVSGNVCSCFRNFSQTKKWQSQCARLRDLGALRHVKIVALNCCAVALKPPYICEGLLCLYIFSQFWGGQLKLHFSFDCCIFFVCCVSFVHCSYPEFTGVALIMCQWFGATVLTLWNWAGWKFKNLIGWIWYESEILLIKHWRGCMNHIVHPLKVWWIFFQKHFWIQATVCITFD